MADPMEIHDSAVATTSHYDYTSPNTPDQPDMVNGLDNLALRLPALDADAVVRPEVLLSVYEEGGETVLALDHPIDTVDLNVTRIEERMQDIMQPINEEYGADLMELARPILDEYDGVAVGTVEMEFKDYKGSWVLASWDASIFEEGHGYDTE